MKHLNQFKKYLRSSLAVVLAILLISGALVDAKLYADTKPVSAADVTTAASTVAMKDGAILHAWCWSFTAIKNNMANIAAAGFTSVQTSPINQCLVGDNGALTFSGHWYYQYQPTAYTIGNYQLGTEAEFKAMCTAADTYGIKIIVDVVANHCTSDYNSISATIKNISGGAFHPMTQISDYSNRQQVTQYSLLGLYDFNTQNTNVQTFIKSFLTNCLNDGADGFRYDAAKHIELPSDNSSYASNFWPNVLNNSAVFQYGEILQDSTTPSSTYANYMAVTASDYGNTIRTAIKNNNVTVGNILNYGISVDVDKLVTWVESHDNYANDSTTSQWMTEEQIALAWGIVAGREAGAPLFFARPLGGGGTTADNRFPEKNKIGTVGSTQFMGPKIKAINLFRNAMNGQNEYLRNPNSSTKVLMIDRGTIGTLIVNTDTSSYTLSSVTTNLANGTYTEKINGSTFTVTNGKISGTVPARGIAVIY